MPRPTSATAVVVGKNAGLIGFFGTSGVTLRSSASLTNNVTVGGSADIIANFTDLSTYANDANAIRNDIYQLSRKVKELGDGLRSLGLFN